MIIYSVMHRMDRERGRNSEVSGEAGGNRIVTALQCHRNSASLITIL